MLQQTRVSRVVPFYKKFIKKFPTARALARAPLREVLREWQGLGYNRRAKYVHEAAKILSEAERNVGGSRAPVHLSRRRELSAKRVECWESLPGVGHYTARAIVTFAFNKPEVFIETNIRTVFIYSGILKNTRIDSKISDKEILPLVAQALKKSRMQPREFYWALMDYGAYLKARGIRINARSTHYVKQPTFEGSARQLRGALLRELLKKPTTLERLTKNLSPRTRREVERELLRLQRDGLVVPRAHRYAIAR